MGWPRDDIENDQRDREVPIVKPDKIGQIKLAWAGYKLYLREKCLAEEGKEWDFECPFHKRIDNILKEK